MKRPAFQFYPADWRKDMALQSCSVAARGLWVDMMCIAHECEPYGHLVVNDKPMSAAHIARLAGISERECAKLIAELEGAGVPSRTDGGALYSRRMVRDESIREARAKGGEAGSEHGIKGKEHGIKGGRPGKVRGVIYPPLNPPPSSSSSSSSSEKHSLPTVESAAPTRAGAVVLRMKAEGLTAGISPSHPKLAALIDAGATDDEFADAARDAVGKGKPFAYALAAVEGRRADAAKTAGVVHRGPLRAVNKQEALEAQNRAVSERWVANMQAQARAAKEVQA